MNNELIEIGTIRSPLKKMEDAPLQGHEGGSDAKVVIHAQFHDALLGLSLGDEIVVITWLHHSNRGTLQVYPRNDNRNQVSGVFATRSAERPNPLGLHSVKILSIEENLISVAPLEAIDGTPVVDIKIKI